MFTGLVTDVGELVSREGGIFKIRSRYPAADIAIGASIACGGCCLTATVIDHDDKGSQFMVDVSNETLSKTTLGDWTPGTKVNLERSMTAGGELGGHVVTGHSMVWRGFQIVGRMVRASALCSKCRRI